LGRPKPDWGSAVEPGPPAAGAAYEITLITPMFGGGVEPGKNDPVTPIRVPSIRGQLRFWWRATAGAESANTRELRDLESKIWGSTESPSPVKVAVERCDRVDGFTMQELTRPPREALKKILFTLPTCTSTRRSFRLTITAPADDFAKHVEPALRAWLNLGGLGTGTRRGCGALYCPAAGLSPPSGEVVEWLGRNFAPRGSREWPVVAQTVCLPGAPVDPLDAWSRLAGLWNSFRLHYPFEDTAHMASPIIFRPVGVGPKLAVPVIVRLEEPAGIKKENKIARQFVEFALTGKVTL